VTTDENHLFVVLESFFEVIHLLEDMNAVYATARPKIYNHNFVLEILIEGQGLVINGVEPLVILREVVHIRQSRYVLVMFLQVVPGSL